MRIINKWDVSDDEKSKFLIDMIKETVYENTLVIVEWLGEPKISTPVALLKESVGELGNVYVYE